MPVLAGSLRVNEIGNEAHVAQDRGVHCGGCRRGAIVTRQRLPERVEPYAIDLLCEIAASRLLERSKLLAERRLEDFEIGQRLAACVHADVDFFVEAHVAQFENMEGDGGLFAISEMRESRVIHLGKLLVNVVKYDEHGLDRRLLFPPRHEPVLIPEPSSRSLLLEIGATSWLCGLSQLLTEIARAGSRVV